MKKPREVRCENCVFFAFFPDDKYPSCLRYPPSNLVQRENARQWTYPYTSNGGWCGEFRPKDNLTAVEWVTWLKGFKQDEISNV